MRKAALSVFGLTVLGLLTLPIAVADGGRCNDEFQSVMGGGFSGLRDARNLVITSETEWCEFWDDVHSNMFPVPDCDRDLVDFNEEAAIVVALGSRPNTCYAVNISCVHRAQGSDNRVVFYQEFIPQNGCLCAFVVTHPYTVVKVSKPVGHVNFVGKGVAYSCD